MIRSNNAAISAPRSKRIRPRRGVFGGRQRGAFWMIRLGGSKRAREHREDEDGNGQQEAHAGSSIQLSWDAERERPVYHRTTATTKTIPAAAPTDKVVVASPSTDALTEEEEGYANDNDSLVSQITGSSEDEGRDDDARDDEEALPRQDNHTMLLSPSRHRGRSFGRPVRRRQAHTNVVLETILHDDNWFSLPLMTTTVAPTATSAEEESVASTSYDGTYNRHESREDDRVEPSSASVASSTPSGSSMNFVEDDDEIENHEAEADNAAVVDAPSHQPSCLTTNLAAAQAYFAALDRQPLL